MKEFYACNIKRNKTIRINSKKVSLLAVLDILFKLTYTLNIEATYFCTFLNLNDFCFLDSETALRRSTVIKKKDSVTHLVWLHIWRLSTIMLCNKEGHANHSL